MRRTPPSLAGGAPRRAGRMPYVPRFPEIVRRRAEHEPWRRLLWQRDDEAVRAQLHETFLIHPNHDGTIGSLQSISEISGDRFGSPWMLDRDTFAR